jgi:hypothetical protein
MARGWESKAVEDQISEAEERARRKAAGQEELTPEERARRERLDSLHLSRARILTQLEQAHASRAPRDATENPARAGS